MEFSRLAGSNLLRPSGSQCSEFFSSLMDKKLLLKHLTRTNTSHRTTLRCKHNVPHRGNPSNVAGCRASEKMRFHRACQHPQRSHGVCLHQGQMRPRFRTDFFYLFFFPQSQSASAPPPSLIHTTAYLFSSFPPPASSLHLFLSSHSVVSYS